MIKRITKKNNMNSKLRQELEAMKNLQTGDSFTAEHVHTLVDGILEGGGEFKYVNYDSTSFPYPQTIGSTAPSISGLGNADESMIDTIFIMPNKGTDSTATLMIVVDEVDPSTDPKTYQYVYVGNINDLPSDVLTEESIVNDLTSGGTNKPLSAEQGRTLNSHVNYTTCGSGASDQVKLISDDGFVLSTHLRLLVMMTNTNTHTTPKFNINSTGAITVWYNGAVASDTNTWSAGEVLDVYYDGSKYVANTHGGAQFDTGEKVGDVGIDNEPTAESENLVKSGGVQNELALGAVYDVSAKNPTSGPNNDGKWESLSALLSDGNLSTLIPTSVRKGGMSIKFIQSSDNKYVQYRLMATSFSIIPSDWEDIDEISLYDDSSDAEFNITDENGNVIIQSKNGHVKTKNFDSAKTTKIEDDSSDAEFNITDENGNVALQIKNGNLRTKKFDSRDFSKETPNLSVNYPNEVASVITLNQNVSFNNADIFGDTLEFDFKWVGGCLASNGRIYGIPNGNRQVLEIDPVTGRYCLFGYTSSGNFKWTGCAVGEDGLIYGMPRSANSVLVIDPVSQSVKEHSIGTNYGQDHHYGGCIVGKKIYLAPRTANHILVINIDDWSTYRLGETILTTTTRYSAVLKHPNGYIYFIPERNAKLLKLDPNTDTIIECGNIISSCSVYGAAIDPSTLNIYGFTGYRIAGGIMKIDVNNSDELTFIHESEVETGYYGSKLGINGKIYSIVGNGTILYEYDPSNDTVTNIATISDTEGGDYNEAKCAGGVLTEDGSIYLIPAKGRHIYKLNFGNIVNTLSRKVLSSGYFSNY